MQVAIGDFYVCVSVCVCVSVSVWHHKFISVIRASSSWLRRSHRSERATSNESNIVEMTRHLVI